jgi:hypothetical protein
MGELRKLSSGFQAELRDAMHTAQASPKAPPGPSGGIEPPPARTTDSVPPGGKFVWGDLPTSPAAGEADAGKSAP